MDEVNQAIAAQSRSCRFKRTHHQRDRSVTIWTHDPTFSWKISSPNQAGEFREDAKDLAGFSLVTVAPKIPRGADRDTKIRSSLLRAK